jgi:hypothetical protein
MEKKKSAKGLGDTIEKVTKATGIKWFVDRFVGDCGCEDRKEWLNARFPYERTMTHDQVKRLEQLLSKERVTFSPGESQELYAIYNEVFGSNKKPKSCGPCAREITTKLLAVYEKSVS